MNQDEIKRINVYFRIVAIIAFSMIAFGTFFYHFTEKLSYVDSFYFSVITLATVGYGDIVPHTDFGKIFTAFYVIAGIGIIGLFANLLIRRAAANRVEKIEKRLKK